MREVLLHELRTHRVSVDRLADYLLVITETRAFCPRCYARGTATMLAITVEADGTGRGRCEACGADFAWPAW